MTVFIFCSAVCKGITAIVGQTRNQGKKNGAS